MKDIAIFGAGGFGREVACLIKRINKQQPNTWNFIGFFDDDEKIWGAWNEYQTAGTVLFCLIQTSGTVLASLR